MGLASLFKPYASCLNLTPRASRLGLTPRTSRLGLTPRPRPHTSLLGLGLTPHASASTSRLTPRPHASHFFQRQTLKPYSFFNASQLSTLNSQDSSIKDSQARVKEVLEKKTNDQNIFMKEMIMKMRAKFDKYWGECNLLMAFGAILDPRCKMRFIEFCFPLIYPKDEVATNIASIRGSLYELYNEYATLLASNVDEHNEEVVSQSTGTSSGSLVGSRSLLKKNSAWSQFDQFVQRVETVQPEKSDLDVYLEEGVFRCADDPYNYFDALNWWKANSLKYRVLSLMACDILAIPITTVASESTFSAGGRVIDTYRSSLSTDTVQALVCGGDWLRHKFGIKKKPRKRDNTLFEEEVVITIP
ncbi:zinc finger BED domain-containing protein RICESLEEPER 2-like [Quillaja saponaria]|uniref:Zinc finger BED domain-containing protein RICESLEEPER 2-like n=1 Tax=Quillaja saponaria TaxID=32244 RepID=A0AAD7VIB7_QUISA|nr:zinc finger BED domain-containing protein RICESLEEPER 2-like [Quillaja saponaria]